MKTKQILVVILALIFGATTALAQCHGKGKQKKTPEERAQKQTEWMKTDLGLTPEQTTEVEKINLKYALETNKLKQEYNAKRKANSTLKNAELIKVLTPEQYTKLDQLREAKKQQRKEKRQKMRNCMKEIKANQQQ